MSKIWAIPTRCFMPPEKVRILRSWFSVRWTDSSADLTMRSLSPLFQIPLSMACGEERLLMFSCRTRGFCPSCHSKRREEWGEWMQESLLLDVPHRQVVFTIPKMLRIFFKYKRRLLGELCRAAVKALLKYFQAATDTELRPGVVASIQTFGQKINFHAHLHLLVTEGGEDQDGIFHHLASFQDNLLAEFFSRPKIFFTREISPRISSDC
ncbi:MAG: hypothetical protein E3J56_14430, partial [Candidatus Aminicenantes bacterium]